MATPNVGILTNAGKDLIDRVNAGQTKITFTKIVFSSMDNSQLTDDKIRALTTVSPQEVVINNPEVTLDNNTGETRIRATGTNEKLDDGVYVKTYGVFAKDDTGNEILYGLTVSPNPNYFPAYDGVTPQVVTYSYKVIISNTSNITFTNSNDIYLSETDLGESLKPYAKIVYVNQQLDNKVTDNHDGTEQLNGVRVQPFNKLSDTIGGRNLLINTAKLNDSTVCLDSPSNISDTYLGLNIYQVNYMFGGERIYWSYLVPKLKTDTNYVMSEYVRNTSPTKSVNIGMFENDANTGKGSGIVYNKFEFSTTLPPNSGWTRISALINIASFPTKTIGKLRFESYTTLTDGYVQFAGLKFEQGSITTDWTPAPEDKVNVSDMRKPASDVAGIEEVNTKQDKIGYTPADDSKVVHTTDTSNWQKHKLTADDGSAKLVIASGEDVNEKLKAIVGTKDTGKLLVDINAKNNPTGHSLIGEYFCDFDGLVTGYGVGQDGAMWGFTYSGTTALWKLIPTAKTPGIPSLAVNYKVTSKAFDYTLTAPEKDGLSDIIQYNLLWKDHSVDDWTTVIVKPDSLTGRLTGVGIKKTYDFKASAQNAVGTSGFTDVITLRAATVPGIPKLAVKHNAGKTGFDYTVTAPESDGGSEITGYSLEYQKQGGKDWTKVAIKPDILTGTITGGIEAGSNYFFRVNAENAAGSSDYFMVSQPVSAVDGSIYGASWDGSSSGILQRTDAAVGLKAGINGAQNDFDTRGPWELMDKTVHDSYGNAFVRVPKFYIRKTQDKSKSLSTWQVSLVKQGDDWYLPNCFYNFDSKKELAYVDVSRYEGFIESTHLKSESGVTPTNNVDINDFRNAATALNADGKKGYHLWDVHTLDALQVLFTIEFATLDSQSIMKGVTDNVLSGAESTGAADGVKGSSGNVDHSSGYGSMTYRGIENLYGNLAMWTDGLNITNLSLYSCDDATKYVSDTFTDPYYMLNYSLPAYDSGNTNITSLGFDKDHPSVEAPTSYNSDNYNTYYHDEEYTTNSGNYVVCTGGGWGWDAGVSGLWCWVGNYSSTYAGSYVGSRLLKKAL